MERKEISKSVLKRLPGYLSYLKSLPDGTATYISATALANALGMGEVQVRKDLAMVSDGGRPKVGYLRERLMEDISQFLGYDNTTDAILVGAGKLGQALLGYGGFEAYGLNILAAFDAAPASDKTDEGKPIYAMDKLDHFCRSNKVLMGIITVPSRYAQEVCDKLIACGIKAVWNFTPFRIRVPEEIVVQNTSLYAHLGEILTILIHSNHLPDNFLPAYETCPHIFHSVSSAALQ